MGILPYSLLTQEHPPVANSDPNHIPSPSDFTINVLHEAVYNMFRVIPSLDNTKVKLSSMDGAITIEVPKKIFPFLEVGSNALATLAITVSTLVAPEAPRLILPGSDASQ